MPGKLPYKKLLEANSNGRLAAKAAQLTYIAAGEEGFRRQKKGNKFLYFSGNKIITNKKHLERIKKLAIPPSWTDVWICRSPKGHIQATGMDLKGRKQYRYHAEWNRIRSETKFHHLYEFGKKLPALRRKIKKDIRQQKLTREKVLATAIELMEKTYIRVGNESYEKENGSYGLTTLKDKHVAIQKHRLCVSFNGKKGVQNKIAVQDRKLARIIKQCRDIPGKALFQYYDENNKRHSIDSTMLNNYLKEATAPEFSAKDIRTWAGSVQAINYYLSGQPNDQPKDPVKNITGMIDWVSQKLGNTKTICKKYYIHPSVITFCEEQKEIPSVGTGSNALSKSEQILMCILKPAGL